MHHKPVKNEHIGEAQAFDEDQQQRELHAVQSSDMAYRQAGL